uniref:Methyltransferase domain-containing protein n=1 Tax=Phenylobacterium glaciei TaxID=2803784 RepID=A0A974S8C2_9CAUL|nr:methyltransferase domain-containing protein [Phenylobacterium glaciei]
MGLDLSPAMVAAAAERLAAFPQASCRQADATALGGPDACFDAAVSTQVYEYVADMPAALAELRRVLVPGGRALILDTDWRSLVWHSSDEARMARVLACWDAHLADPHLPARLGPAARRRLHRPPGGDPAHAVDPLAAGQLCRGMMRSISNFVRANAERAGLAPRRSRPGEPISRP